MKFFLPIVALLLNLVFFGHAHAVDFTAPGQYEWIVPADTTRIQVKLWGGGGAGGTGKKIDNSHRAGQGGGSGGYLEQVLTVKAGDRYVVRVGAGGVAQLGVSSASGGGASEFYPVANPDAVFGASGGGGGVSYVWDENYAGAKGSPHQFGGEGGTSNTPAMGGIGYVGGSVSGTRGGSGAVIQGDDRGNPSATSGGSAPAGGSGGSRGRLGPDGSGHCNSSSPAPRGIFGLPWWASPPRIVIIDALTSDGTDCSDPSLRAQHGGGPGGGGGGSDTGLGANGGNGKVSITILPPENPSSGGGSPSIPGNPSDGGNSPSTPPSNPPVVPPVQRSSSGGYNQASVKLVSQTKPIPQTLASQTIALTQMPYTGLDDWFRWLALILPIVIVSALVFMRHEKRAV